MGIVVVPTYGSDPATLNAANLDAKVAGLASEFNGSIDDANIKTGAAIKNAKLNLASVAQDVTLAGTNVLSGATTISGALTLSNALTMTAKNISEAKGANVASATTTECYVADGNYIHITGTTTITSLGTAAQAGDCRTIVFDGALILTHNATSLILPTGANITTVAGDTAVIRAETTANTRVVSYTRADGTPVANVTSTPSGIYKNLIVQQITVSTVDVNADELVLADASGSKVTLSSVDLTADITESGVNGRDTGAESDGWWYVWVIYNGTTTASLLSLATTIGTITLPEGYTYASIVGAAYNATNILDFKQYGNYVATTLRTAASGNTSGAWATVATDTFVPAAISNVAFGAVNSGDTSEVGVRETDMGNKNISQAGAAANVADSFWQLMVDDDQDLEWTSNQASAQLEIDGYIINKIG